MNSEYQNTIVKEKLLTNLTEDTAMGTMLCSYVELTYAEQHVRWCWRDGQPTPARLCKDSAYAHNRQNHAQKQQIHFHWLKEQFCFLYNQAIFAAY